MSALTATEAAALEATTDVTITVAVNISGRDVARRVVLIRDYTTFADVANIIAISSGVKLADVRVCGIMTGQLPGWAE